MTKVSNYQVKVTREDLIKAIKAYRKKDNVRTVGMEMERFILREDGGLPDAKTHDVLYLALRKSLGDNASVEPGAHMIEIKTGVHKDAVSLNREMSETFAALKKETAAAGLKIADTSDLPQFPLTDLRNNLISRIDPETGKTRRVTEIMSAYEKNGWTDNANWGCGTTSIQLTHSVEDIDQLHRWARVHAAMSPLYFAAFENRARANGNVHEGIRLRGLMKERGLVAEYVFSAKDGSDFAEKYVDFVLQNKLLTTLDENGQDVILPQPTAFRDLPESQQTLGNFLQAASFSWNVSKIKLIVDEDALEKGEVRLGNLLLEARDIDVSDRAVLAVAGWFCALTESELTLSEAEIRLEQIGIPVVSNPKVAAERTRAALDAVQNDPRYLETAFGDPAKGIKVRDAIAEIVLPIFKSGGDPAGAADIWKEVAKSQKPYFKPERPPAQNTPKPGGPKA